MEKEVLNLESPIEKALAISMSGQCDGAHHKTWTIDQMVRALTNCPVIEKEFTLRDGSKYKEKVQGESEEYKKFVSDFELDRDTGEQIYEWELGIP